MASAKKNVKKVAKGKKPSSPARKPAPKAAKKPAAGGADKKALQKAQKEIAAAKAAAKKAAEQAAAQAKKAAEQAASAAKRAKDEAERRVAAAKAAEKAAIERERQKSASEKAALQKKLADEKAAAKAREAAEKAAQKLAAQQAKEAEKARLAAEKQAAKEAAAAAKQAAKEAAAAEGKTAKKKPIPTTSLAATPVFRPLHEPPPAAAPPPPPAKPGHVDHQILSALSYGIFSAVNKSFGPAGRPVVKNASLRMLEYGYKRGWLPPKAKEPIRALNEFFGRLETMGYAETIHVAKKGDHQYVLEVVGLADFDAVWSLREMHMPLLPVFLGGMVEAILDQYFRLRVTLEPTEIVEAKRGLHIPFIIHEATTMVSPEPGRIVPVNRFDDED